MADARRHAPAVARNRDPILEVLRGALPAAGLILEIASGTGEHCAWFAARLPAHLLQPSDPDAEARASIDAWTTASGLANIRRAADLDAAAPVWPLAGADAVLCINMVHIAPWRATEGLFAGAGRLLPPGAPLYLYGPYKRGGAHTAPSNAVFDADLRSHDPEWGIRDLETVVALAAGHGFSSPAVTEMPANNLSLVFRAGSRA